MLEPSFEKLPPCWEMMNCQRNDCPAWNNKENPCWRIPKTFYKEHSNHPYSQRFEKCADCPVFIKQSEAGPLGCMPFLFSQVDQFSAAFNNLPDGVIITDRDKRIQYFSKTAEDITGIKSSRMLGMNLSASLKVIQVEECTPDEVTFLSGNNSSRDLTIKRPDGCRIPLLFSISLLRNPAGNVIGTLVVFTDISKRKNLESNLLRSETKYRRLFEGSKDMIFITSHDGNLREVNQACVDILGYGSKYELLLLPGIEEIYDNPLHWRVFQRQINLHGFVKDFDSCFKKKDGTRLHCLISGNAVLDESCRIIGYEGIAKDITARMDAMRNFRQRHLEMRILNSVALAMNKSQDLDTILTTALKKVLEALNLSSGAIFLIQRHKHAFSLRAQRHLDRTKPDIPVEIEFRDKVLMKGLLGDNVCLEPEPIFPPFRIVLKMSENRNQELTCFLITSKDKASGFMAFVVPPNRDITTGQDFHLLGSVANFLGGAIENASLLHTVRQHREELRDLTGKLYHKLDVERKRIAQDLHDETGQSLTGIRLTLEALEKNLSPDQTHIVKAIEEVKGQIEQAHQEIRRISYRLHPALLSDLGLEPALEAYFTDVSQKSDLKIDYTVVGFEERVNPEIEITLYRICQEALNNAVRHSKARHFTLSIIKSYPNIIFQAQDDGIGMNPDRLTSQKQTLGLVGMRERVYMLKGRFSIAFSKGKGTRIRAEIPL